MNTHAAPTIEPTTTSTHDTGDSLLHFFCECQTALKDDAKKTAWCGKKPSPSGWQWHPHGPATTRDCIVCVNLMTSAACQHCGKSTGSR